MKLNKRAGAMVVVILMAAAMAACEKEVSRSPRTKPSGTSRADFKPGDIRPVSPSDRPESKQVSDAEVPKVISLINGLYDTAFLDPTKWSNGSHPGLADFFTAEARGHIGPNLGGLALADLAPKVKGLRPTKQDAPRISFFIEDDLSVPLGIVTTAFEAKATPVQGKIPVAIGHNGTYWVVKEGDAYKIYAYATELKADSQTKAAAFGVPAGGSPR